MGKFSFPRTKSHLGALDNEDETTVFEKNRLLSILATVFPHILPEVHREIITTFHGDSCLQIAVEQLLKYEDQLVRGRWRPKTTLGGRRFNEYSDGGQLVTIAEEFRQPGYKIATRTWLCEEFKSLGQTKIEAVLAEENYCYSRARLTLGNLVSRTRRNALSVLLGKWRKLNPSGLHNHYMLVWLPHQGSVDKVIPRLRSTGNPELDRELQEEVLRPILTSIKERVEFQDWDVAAALNEAEARDAGAIYECECCYSDTTFEQMASCTIGGHYICFRCIGYAVSEALFGQSWRRNIEHVHGQLRCLAPMSNGSCDGCIPLSSVRCAIMQHTSSEEALMKLESRLAEEAVFKSGLPLVHCPFCPYVEVDELYLDPTTIRYRINTSHFGITLVLLVAMSIGFPLMLLYVLMSHTSIFKTLPRLGDEFSQSLARFSHLRRRPQRLQCRSPSCGLRSCMICLREWFDPHICFESATSSLRTTVEAARTAALKRTCPRCGLAFIKESGCNKLTCICGYLMCYICRQGLGRTGGGESYRHFCQHFRAAGGACGECDKCDLYRVEDDETLVDEAGAMAEKQWKDRNGVMGDQSGRSGHEKAATSNSSASSRRIQRLLDWWVESVITC